MNNKWKLHKDLPLVDKGTIIETVKEYNYYGEAIYSIKGYSFNEKDMQHLPEWFGRYLFTIDGVNVYEYDYIWKVNDDKSISKLFVLPTTVKDCSMFIAYDVAFRYSKYTNKEHE